MPTRLEDTNLWLAQAIFDLGGVTFGDYTIGRSTVHSPVYVNPRVLISRPFALRQVAKLMQQELLIGQTRRKRRCSPFDLVAGVPYGGLHVATAFTLLADVPLIYALRPSMAVEHGERVIEGRYRHGQTVLIVDDLISSGGSVLQTAATLEDVGLEVRDVLVLIDREVGAATRLAEAGYNLIPILKLKTMLTYYHTRGLISGEAYESSVAYLESPHPPSTAE